ncbi:hypothetical protein [Prauserella cavernicola]|uniref:Uncharacterized protein n=1 Tax=Prauserella cavernicola TaxID=2800127 RepID=A0A934QUJ0_9PSEU|nr:hypothetical protein [Prauserella cavernicola]MBK1785594.1 hypothetical protein [Prauserella cavernicola]
MPETSLQNAVASALISDNPDDVIEGIKGAVIAELEKLDPSAEIKKTDYFNHSFAPDLVLSWGARQDREVYLRYNFRSTQAARDVDLLGGSNPVFFSLDSSHDDSEVADELEGEIERSPNALVTNAPSIDEFAEFDNLKLVRESVAAPLFDLFRRNVVRGGKGLIISQTAADLPRYRGSDNLGQDIDYIDRFESTVSRLFREDASLRLRRAASIVRMARTGDIEMLHADEDGGENLVRGKLETDEIRILLPYLLRRAQEEDESTFWEYIGSMVGLKEIQKISAELEEVDIGSLVRANLHYWRANRSAVSLNSEWFDEEEHPEPRWYIHAKMLTASAGPWTVHFTTDKRQASGRDDSPLARWEDLRPALSGSAVSSAELQGVVRRISVSTNDESSDVLRDVDSIFETMDDDFKLRRLSVRGTVAGASDVDVDFKHNTAEGNDAALVDLARSSFDILGYRYPISEGERVKIFGEQSERE